MTTSPSFLAAAVVFAMIGIYLFVQNRGEVRLAQANADLIAGRHSQALAELDGLTGEFGRRALALRGYARLGNGQLEPAGTAFRDALRRDPNNWVLQRDYAIVLLGMGRRAKAQARMSRARSLNPRMPLPPGFAASE